MSENENEWFKNWFDTAYYHILYKKRDHSEASRFIDALVDFLAPQKGSKFLDLACGKGRHSIYLNQKGFDVTGLDLSHNSIQCAKQLESQSLRFLEHDMRLPLQNFEFDYILNLFTSFGYFDEIEDDIAVIRNVMQCLKPGGTFILDYFNAAKPNANFDVLFTKTIDNIDFEIIKHIKDGRIIKEITVNDSGKILKYAEQVRLYNLEQFKQIVTDQGLTIVQTFGSYDLETYNEATSDRLILVVKN